MPADHRRPPARAVRIGHLTIGGGRPVAVQSMTNTSPRDPAATLAQIERLAAAGADIVRCAVPSRERLAEFGEIVRASRPPVVADVHFDWRIAAGALRAGAAKVRINPGNMRPDTGGLEDFARLAADLGRAARVGVNAGSARAGAGRALSTDAPDEDANLLAERLADEAAGYAERFERAGLRDIVLSVKAPDAATTVAANRALARRGDWPLHLGLTHAGLAEEALLKSAVALGGLLLDGIGDTIRLSYTGDPAAEVTGALALLRAAGLRRDRPNLVSCPTCGRCRVDLAAWAAAVRRRLAEIPGSPTVAVMGCEVNGPGEAAAADAGLAASGGGKVMLFAGGKPLRQVDPARAVDELIALCRSLAAK